MSGSPDLGKGDASSSFLTEALSKWDSVFETVR